MFSVSENIIRSTVGIILRLRKTLHLVGTGVLIKLQGQFFVVSAAHVIRGCRKYHGTVGILGSEGEFVNLEGGWVCSGKGQYGTMEDPIDVAASPCDRSTRDKLLGKTFLGEDKMDVSDEGYGEMLFLFGYPISLSYKNSGSIHSLSIRPLLIKTYEFSGNTHLVSEYRKKLHLLLNAEEFSPMNFDGRREARCKSSFLGNLSGLSGCGVWASKIQTETLSEPYTQKRIVALQTGVYTKQKIIKATRWSAVMDFLRHSFPELRMEN